jgi:hypothetical protein
MNRTQAIERVDEILGEFAEMYVSGRCPTCGALLFDEQNRQLPPETVATLRVVHSGSCEVSRGTDELASLSRRFGIALEPVLWAAAHPGAWVVGVRRAGTGRPREDEA